MSSKNTLIIIAAVIFVGIGIWLGTMFTGGDEVKDSEYSAVYMISGDIYFGKLSWFPKPHITNAWHLDRSVDAENKPQTALVPVKSALWGPSEDLYLNKDQIIFWSRLREDSQVAKAMDNPEKLQGNQQAPSTTTESSEPTP
jgi:hypothetical protein